jgi:hypothetical protein
MPIDQQSMTNRTGERPLHRRPTPERGAHPSETRSGPRPPAPGKAGATETGKRCRNRGIITRGSTVVEARRSTDLDRVDPLNDAGGDLGK